MILKIHKPAGNLERFVDSITFYSGYTPDHSIERLLPDGAAHMLINLDREPKSIYDNDSLVALREFRSVWFSGMQRKYISISAGINSSMMVIRFKPGGLYALLGVPMVELTDTVIDADAIVRSSAITKLVEQIHERADPIEKISVAEDWLDALLDDSRVSQTVNYAATSLQLQPSMENIGRIAASTGLSNKQLISRFKNFVGLSPKYFQRVLRFNVVLQAIERKGHESWTQLAYDCGFYDQAHFIREFKYFSGFTPTVFESEKGDHVNYVPVG